MEKTLIGGVVAKILIVAPQVSATVVILGTHVVKAKMTTFLLHRVPGVARGRQQHPIRKNSQTKFRTVKVTSKVILVVVA